VSTISNVIQSLSNFTSKVNSLLTGKVDKVNGKQLSTEDYTTEDKTKLSTVKSMAMRDLHVSTSLPDNLQGTDGDIWLVVKP